jgi:hypothetical protein
MLATLDISSAKDDQGNAVSFTPEFIAGVVRYVLGFFVLVRALGADRFRCYRCPAVFPCRIKPRDHVNSDIVDGWRTTEF